jgi:hypothetical protein
MYVQSQWCNKKEIQTRNRIFQLIRSKAQTAMLLVGLLLCCLLPAPGDSVLAMKAMQQHEEVLLVDGDVGQWSAGQPLAAENQEDGWFQMPETTGVDFAKLVFFMAVFLTANSLLTSGKRGWGWILVGIIAGAVTIVAKGFLSMFVEVTSEYCPPDWDED